METDPPEQSDRDLADLIAERTGRDAEEIRRVSEEFYIQPLDEALEEAGILSIDE